MTEEPQPGPADGFAVGSVFDVVIVEASERDGGFALEVVITAGPKKGDMLELVTTGRDLDGSEGLIDLLGIPATVTVTPDGPQLRL